jgi:hypothetical protein
LRLFLKKQEPLSKVWKEKSIRGEKPLPFQNGPIILQLSTKKPKNAYFNEKSSNSD